MMSISWYFFSLGNGGISSSQLLNGRNHPFDIENLRYFFAISLRNVHLKLKIPYLKRKIIFQTPIFGVQNVNFTGCISKLFEPTPGFPHLSDTEGIFTLLLGGHLWRHSDSCGGNATLTLLRCSGKNQGGIWDLGHQERNLWLWYVKMSLWFWWKCGFNFFSTRSYWGAGFCLGKGWVLRDVERLKIPDAIGMFGENCSGEVGEVTRLTVFWHGFWHGLYELNRIM